MSKVSHPPTPTFPSPPSPNHKLRRHPRPPSADTLTTEILGILGFPARLLGRSPLVVRFLSIGLRGPFWPHQAYARARYGPRYRWRFWLVLDVADLKRAEVLVNDGSDEEVLAFQSAQLKVFQMIAIIGALLAQAALTALQLPELSSMHLLARAFFLICTVSSLLAVYFTCLQHLTYGTICGAPAVRAWLSNGITYRNSSGALVLQSSYGAQQMLQAPFELLSIALSLFLGGIGIYLGSAWTNGLDLGTTGGLTVDQANLGVLVAFIVCTFFALAVIGQVLGMKEAEEHRRVDSLLPENQ